LRPASLRLALPLLAALLLLGARQGEPEPPGLAYRPVVTPGGSLGHLLTVDLRHTDLRLLDARDLGAPALTAREFVEKSGATAAFNGPFFDLDGSPMGLLVVDGKKKAPLRPVDWGVFALDAAGVHIVHTKDWHEPEGLRQAMQVGPRLVVDGQPLTLKRQSARRTALCALADGRLKVLVVGTALEASDLAGFLVSEGCRDALNLDGGDSTQLYLRRAGIEVDEPGGDPVPVAVGLFVHGTTDIARGDGCSCF
jgi:uncharacterized protein YigE (DUF2233 family)